MSDHEDIPRLLRLKRHEEPPEGFYEEFTENFKERQRGEMLSQSARGLLLERFSTWTWGLGPGHWILAGSAAISLSVAGYFFVQELREAKDHDEAGLQGMLEPSTLSVE